MSRDAEFIRLRKQMQVERVAFLAVIVVLLFALFLKVGPARVCAIEVDGKTVAYVDSPRTAGRLYNAIADEYRQQYGVPIAFAEQVNFFRVRGSSSAREMTPDRAHAALQAALTPVTPGAMIEVDGKPVVALTTQQQAQNTLDTFKRRRAGQMTDDMQGPVFKQRVTVKEGQVDVRKLVSSVGKAIARLTFGAAASRSYKVRPGDTAWGVAGSAGLTVTQLKQLNPTVRLDRIKAGQILTLAKEAPALTVVTSRTVQQVEAVPFKVDDVKSNRLAAGKQEVSQPGIPGKVQQTIRIVYENGEEVRREVVDQKVLQAPQNKTVVHGTGPG